MKCLKIVIIVLHLVVGGCIQAVAQISDNGDGTFSNPVIYADAPDPSVIRVDDTFYMVSTTMHMSPGCTIMKSTDLVNWSVVNYAYDQLEKTDAFALKNGKNDYASGSWAANLRYDKYEKRFYLIVTCNTTSRSYIFSTSDIEKGPWHRSVVDKCYDPGFLFEDTGTKCKKYIVNPSDDLGKHEAYLREFTVDADYNVTLGKPRIIIDYANVENPAIGLRAEGYHGYKIGEYYYIFMIQGAGWQRQEIVWRSKTLEPGSFEVKRVFAGNIVDQNGVDVMPFTGIAQGGIVDTKEGNWYAFLFQDYGSVGRIPVLIPIRWEEDWPVLGNEGQNVNQILPKPVQGGIPRGVVIPDEFNNGKERNFFSDQDIKKGITAGISYKKLQELAQTVSYERMCEIVAQNEYGYNGSNLNIIWQWNHNPNNNLWSLTERKGYLRFKSGILSKHIQEARNTLTQRTFGPVCSGNVALEIQNMNDGDVAGLAAFQNQYGFVGVKMEDGKKYIVMQRARQKDDCLGEVMEKLPLSQERIYLRVDFNFRDKQDKANFFYSLDGEEWRKIGDTLQMHYDWPHFVGYRFGLFYYAMQHTGGCVDFDYFHVSDKILNDLVDDEVVISLNQPGAEISPSMYGIFFEEINHAGDGGLYAELVQNRSFEELEMPEGYHAEGCTLYPKLVKNHITGEIKPEKYRWTDAPVPAWSLQPHDSLVAQMRLTRESPKFKTAPNNLEVAINDATTPVRLINEGYWGMGIKAGAIYKLRVILRTIPGYTGHVSAYLLSEKGDVLASVPLEIATNGDWKDINCELEATATDSRARLALEFDAPGKIWIDYVSLFPEHTFMNRPNGLRQDVAEMLVGLRPAFVRWPGGCVVEGITLENRFEWKKTLGDPAARPGEYSTWGYRCSYGFGYYEMLQFCEDIGAAAMYVCNVGLGCQFRMGDASPDDKINYYLEDCLDAIEYALGDEITEWGKRRAADGHPAPFPLQYVEIGNENWGDEYDKRFDIFYQAIKKKYPQLILISNHGLYGTGHITATDMIDPHYYVTPDFFYQNSTLFDKHPRGKYTVYVGEYACNQQVGSGNMNAALAEAAFIGGMERNGDLVKMASYAPLLENRHDRSWSTNLIWMDTDRVLGRASYYVQQMAAANRPTRNVKSSIIMSTAPSDSIPRRFVTSGYDEITSELILKVVNGTNKAYTPSFTIEGVNVVKEIGQVIQLSAQSGEEENSWEEPTKITPQTAFCNKFGEKFHYEFPPFSYTILRIKVKQ